MEQLNRIIATLLLVIGTQSDAGNSMQLYRRIIRQYGHPPFEQIILKPAYQPIHPHRPYHPITKYDETAVDANPHTHPFYNPSFNQHKMLFYPEPQTTLFQAIPTQPSKPHPFQPHRVNDYYPTNHYTNPYNKRTAQNPYRQISSAPQPIRYSRPKANPDYKYHNPSDHYIPQPHHHHQHYQDEYHNDEDPPVRQISHDQRGGGEEILTKHVTNIERIKMMPHRDEPAENDEEEESAEQPDVSKTTGPVFTYVKTDPNANVKWAVRHYVGKKYN